LEGKIKARDAKIEELELNQSNAIDKEEFERLAKERDALLEENRRWEELKKKFEQDLADMKAENEALKQKSERMKADAEQCQELENKTKEAVARAEELAKDLENARLANRSYIKKVSRLLEENARFKSKLNEAGDFESLAKENDELKSRIRKLEEDLEQAMVGTVDAPADILNLRDIYESLNEMAHNLETDMEVLEQLGDIEDLKSHVPPIKEALDKIKENLNTLDNVLTSMGF
jgi:chromosome segregation ATPase